MEAVSFDKILARISKLAVGLRADAVAIAQKTVAGVRDGISTEHLDELAAEVSAALSGTHPDYGVLAARIAISNLHKSVPPAFATAARRLAAYCVRGSTAALVEESLARLADEHAARIDAALCHDRDYDYDYFGFKTLERSYLLKIDGKIAERPQHMLMRVSLGIHGSDIDAALETYEAMSLGLFTHASPTLFNAGTPRPALSSCFLLPIQDSIEGIYAALAECASISKNAGGIGIAAHDTRAAGSYIRGTNGHSNGLVPMLRVFDATARYVDQGGGKRKGAFAIYLEPWHADVFSFLDLRKNRGAEELRARDLFYALWVPDLFMRRVAEDADWSLFCPAEAPGLADAWGGEFDELYRAHEAAGRARAVVKARDLWNAILNAQIETGTPYMLYKDAANRTSNQQNLGTIRCSNLCTEIIQFSSADETACCNLASVAVNRCVRRDGARGFERLVGSIGAPERSFDFDELARVVRIATRNLNKVIDVNHYPSDKARRSNLRHRPIGIGVQGLADAFALLALPFDSPAAAELNRKIAETVYFAALDASCELAEVHGPYETYAGSPVSRGVLHHDVFPDAAAHPDLALDWTGLRRRIAEHGLRNSLLIAPMPTASTSQILGNTECFEPATSNIYVRRVLSGEFVVANKHLLSDLEALGLWTPSAKADLIAADGSVRDLPVPQKLKEIYKTAWEISGKTLIDLAAARQPFIDQSQSLNAFMADPTHAKLTSYHFYAWSKGLKTGMYYLRTKPASSPIKFTLDATAPSPASTTLAPACSLADPTCVSCSS